MRHDPSLPVTAVSSSAINTAFHAAKHWSKPSSHSCSTLHRKSCPDIADHTADRHRDSFITPIHSHAIPAAAPIAAVVAAQSAENAVTGYGCKLRSNAKASAHGQPFIIRSEVFCYHHHRHCCVIPWLPEPELLIAGSVAPPIAHRMPRWYESQWMKRDLSPETARALFFQRRANMQPPLTAKPSCDNAQFSFAESRIKRIAQTGLH